MVCRIIYCIQIDFERRQADPPQQPGSSMIVWLNRDGQSVKNGTVGLPPHRLRVIDLRPGDGLEHHGRSDIIKSIRAYRQNWCTEESANDVDDGYVYRLEGETRTVEELRRAAKAQAMAERHAG